MQQHLFHRRFAAVRNPALTSAASRVWWALDSTIRWDIEKGCHVMTEVHRALAIAIVMGEELSRLETLQLVFGRQQEVLKLCVEAEITLGGAVAEELTRLQNEISAVDNQWFILKKCVILSLYREEDAIALRKSFDDDIAF